MTDRLLEPGNAFAFERASAADRLGHRQRLVVIDRQLDGVGKPLAHRTGDREVLLEVGLGQVAFDFRSLGSLIEKLPRIGYRRL